MKARFYSMPKTNFSVPRRLFALVAAAAAGMVLTFNVGAAPANRVVVVWSEVTAPKNVYPQDINGAIAAGLKGLEGWDVITANIDQPNQGISDDLLNRTDVLIWWGHKRHGEVKDDLVNRIVKRVKEQGMGFISVHSSHYAKPYKKLMGTACSWGEYVADGTKVHVTVKEPSHPIAEGVKDFDLPAIERYGEPFAVPQPEAVVFDGTYTKPNGSTAPGRMGLCWTVGKGKVFYFTPGHETYKDFYLDPVPRIFRNAVAWAAPKP
jgi:trehalose utilization protein